MPAAGHRSLTVIKQLARTFHLAHLRNSWWCRLLFALPPWRILLLLLLVASSIVAPTALALAAPPTPGTTTRTRTAAMSEAVPTSNSTAAAAVAATTAAPFPLETLAAAASAYAAAHGIQVEHRATAGSGSTSVFQCAPVSLLPNAFPRTAFAQAVELAPDFNLLVDRVSRDAAFLRQTLGGSGVAAADPYTAQLLRLYQAIYDDDDDDDDENKDSISQTAKQHARSADRLGIHRSDYMLHRTATTSQEDGGSDEYEIKQVELNTIASSFAGLAAQVAGLHAYLLQRYAVGSGAEAQAVRAFLDANREAVKGDAAAADADDEAGVPPDPALERLPAALHVAVQRYRERHSVPAGAALGVLFVVQEGETNTVDQRLLEFHLFRRHGVPVARRSLRQIEAEVACDAASGALTLRSGDALEIAAVYFRAGYAPTDYPGGPGGAEWEARERLELSRAAKCPPLGYHLAGTKKVQQELARPGALERFFAADDGEEEREVPARLRRAFAGLYSLGADAGAPDRAAVREVLREGAQGRYVLKPQREGGGYNFYGDRLAAKLRQHVTLAADGDGEDGGDGGKMTLDPKLGEYILMERLFPPQQTAILLRAGKVEGTGDSVSELGCFGAIVASGDGEVVHNEYAGFLLRTKFSNVDEGGVASGFATLSSPYLC